MHIREAVISRVPFVVEISEESYGRFVISLPIHIRGLVFPSTDNFLKLFWATLVVRLKVVFHFHKAKSPLPVSELHQGGAMGKGAPGRGDGQGRVYIALQSRTFMAYSEGFRA